MKAKIIILALVVSIIIILSGVCGALFYYSHSLTSRIVDFWMGIDLVDNRQDKVLFAQIDNPDILLVSISRKVKQNFQLRDYLTFPVEIEIKNPDGKKFCISAKPSWCFPLLLPHCPNSDNLIDPENIILEYCLFVKLSKQSKDKISRCLVNDSSIAFKDKFGEMEQKTKGLKKISLPTMERIVAPLYFYRQSTKLSRNVEFAQQLWNDISREYQNHADSAVLGVMIQYIDRKLYLFDLYLNGYIL